MIWLGIDLWPTAADGIIFGQAMAFLAASHALILGSLYATGNVSISIRHGSSVADSLPPPSLAVVSIEG